MIDGNDVVFMKRAFELAKAGGRRGEVPVGALVTIGGAVISESSNRKEGGFDPTAHAEIIAIREAAVRIGNWRLAGSTLYVTKEPCIMCCGAIVHARIARVVYGCLDEKGGGAESLYRLLTDERLNHRVEVEGGVLADEAAEILREFFSRRRKKGSSEEA